MKPIATLLACVATAGLAGAAAAAEADLPVTKVTAFSSGVAYFEHTGKVAVLLSMDRAKMRRPVRPGDQLVLEAEAIHVRTRSGHCRCRAMVGGEVAAEAEIKFMLVDAEPI